MKLLSIILCAFGGFGILLALSMDTTVATNHGLRVHNIGLVSDRQIYLIASGIALLVGVILFGFSSLRPTSQRFATRNFLVVLMVLILGSVGAWVSVNRKTSSPPLEQSSSPQNTGHPQESSLELPMEPFTVELDGSGHYLQTSMVLLLANSADKLVIQDSGAEIRYAILMLLSSKSLSQVSDMPGKLNLAEEIRNKINGVVAGRASVKQVFFVAFLTQ